MRFSSIIKWQQQTSSQTRGQRPKQAAMWSDCGGIHRTRIVRAYVCTCVSLKVGNWDEYFIVPPKRGKNKNENKANHGTKRNRPIDINNRTAQYLQHIKQISFGHDFVNLWSNWIEISMYKSLTQCEFLSENGKRERERGGDSAFQLMMPFFSFGSVDTYLETIWYNNRSEFSSPPTD